MLPERSRASMADTRFIERPIRGCTVYGDFSQYSANPKLGGHFRVAFCLCVKMSLCGKPSI